MNYIQRTDRIRSVKVSVALVYDFCPQCQGGLRIFYFCANFDALFLCILPIDKPKGSADTPFYHIKTLVAKKTTPGTVIMLSPVVRATILPAYTSSLPKILAIMAVAVAAGALEAIRVIKMMSV